MLLSPVFYYSHVLQRMLFGLNMYFHKGFDLYDTCFRPRDVAQDFMEQSAILVQVDSRTNAMAEERCACIFIFYLFIYTYTPQITHTLPANKSCRKGRLVFGRRRFIYLLIFFIFYYLFIYFYYIYSFIYSFILLFFYFFWGVSGFKNADAEHAAYGYLTSAEPFKTKNIILNFTLLSCDC